MKIFIKGKWINHCNICKKPIIGKKKNSIYCIKCTKLIQQLTQAKNYIKLRNKRMGRTKPNICKICKEEIINKKANAIYCNRCAKVVNHLNISKYHLKKYTKQIKELKRGK